MFTIAKSQLNPNAKMHMEICHLKMIETVFISVVKLRSVSKLEYQIPHTAESERLPSPW